MLMNTTKLLIRRACNGQGNITLFLCVIRVIKKVFFHWNLYDYWFLFQYTFRLVLKT